MELKVSDLKEKDFKTNLQLWAKEVVSYCNNIAKTKVDRDFYAFQSKPKEKPKVLLLGLNPGLSGDDEKRVKHESEEWDNPRRNTVENFIEANSWFYKTGNEWSIFKRFKKTRIVYKDLDSEFEDMVYMNLLYFNSNNFDAFKRKSPNNWKDVFNNCADFTKFLIFEIIKPEKIVCLGAPCFSKLIEGESFEILNNTVKKTIINNTPIYGITHPSKPGMSDKERITTGWTLANEWFNVAIPKDI